MSIIYDPSKLLKKIAPPAKVEKLVKGNLTMKKAALSFVDGIEFLDKKKISTVALKTIRGYQEREAKAQIAGGFEKSAGEAVKDEILDDPKQLIQRVQNEIVFQIKEEIKASYAGEQYEWLPSDAEEPDPEHQLNYGKVFTVGEGEMPGDRFGCRCGMNILVKGNKLELG